MMKYVTFTTHYKKKKTSETPYTDSEPVARPTIIQCQLLCQKENKRNTSNQRKSMAVMV